MGEGQHHGNGGVRIVECTSVKSDGFGPIVLLIVEIHSQILLYRLVHSFGLSVDLEMESGR
jgi:hypothetical protein